MKRQVILKAALNICVVVNAGERPALSLQDLKNAKGCRHCAVKLPDLPIGYRVHNWAIISERQVGVVQSKQGAFYKCKCDCGFEKDQTASRLVAGTTSQCKSCAGKKQVRVIEDITGRSFGSWKVIEQIDNRKVKCECQCFNKTLATITRSNLFGGNCNMCRFCRRATNSKKQWTGFGEISGHRWAAIKQCASKRALDFNITIEYVWDLFQRQNGVCALSGMEIGFKQPFSKSRITGIVGDDTASLDRIDSSKGYIQGNVQWVHKDLQKMKWDFNEQYFLEVCRKVVKNAGV